jgi:hypothetical protein
MPIKFDTDHRPAFARRWLSRGPRLAITRPPTLLTFAFRMPASAALVIG